MEDPGLEAALRAKRAVVRTQLGAMVRRQARRDLPAHVRTRRQTLVLAMGLLVCALLAMRMGGC